MTFEILRPIGPPLYYTVLSSEFVEMLTAVAEQTRVEKIDMGENLAGNLETQLLAVMNDEQRAEFMTTIHQSIFDALVGFDRDSNLIFKSDPSKDKVSYNMGRGPWINFQQPGEFNPYHSHSGELSAVIYINVPEVIEEENKNLKHKTNMPSAGKICFVHGSDAFGVHSSYAHPPKTGEMFIFPAQLKHMVYPYKSDVERISMSFNVHNILTV